jgi:hypothetical protein
VRHCAGEYVRGEVHTNAIESVFSILKRERASTGIALPSPDMTKPGLMAGLMLRLK